MHITSREQIKNALHTPQGEIIFELVGRGENAGAVKQHSLAHIVIPPGKSSPKHYHRRSEETYYILKGIASMRVNGKAFSLSPGQTCLIEVGEVHQVKNNSEEELEFLAVCAPAWHPEDSFLAE